MVAFSEAAEAGELVRIATSGDCGPSGQATEGCRRVLGGAVPRLDRLGLGSGAGLGRARAAAGGRQRLGALADRLADVVQRLGAAHVGDGVEVVLRRGREREPLERRAAPRVVARARTPLRQLWAALPSSSRIPRASTKAPIEATRLKPSSAVVRRRTCRCRPAGP